MTRRRLVVMLILGTVGVSGGGGRLLDPPGRGSEFRVGVPSVPDYDDHRLNCGGVFRQWDKWGGRCGACGDDYGLKVPRPHELGGRFGSGRISRNYTQGQEIEVKVQLIGNLLGYFTLHICDQSVLSSNHSASSQNQSLLSSDQSVPSLDQSILSRNQSFPTLDECLEQNPLRVLSQPEKYRFYPPVSDGTEHQLRYLLPPGLHCHHCVLQWRYRTGRTWEMSQDGKTHSEEFRACSDIAIYAVQPVVHIDQPVHEAVKEVVVHPRIEHFFERQDKVDSEQNPLYSITRPREFSPSSNFSVSPGGKENTNNFNFESSSTPSVISSHLEKKILLKRTNKIKYPELTTYKTTISTTDSTSTTLNPTFRSSTKSTPTSLNQTTSVSTTILTSPITEEYPATAKSLSILVSVITESTSFNTQSLEITEELETKTTRGSSTVGPSLTTEPENKTRSFQSSEEPEMFQTRPVEFYSKESLLLDLSRSEDGFKYIYSSRSTVGLGMFLSIPVTFIFFFIGFLLYVRKSSPVPDVEKKDNYYSQPRLNGHGGSAPAIYHSVSFTEPGETSSEPYPSYSEPLPIDYAIPDIVSASMKPNSLDDLSQEDETSLSPEETGIGRSRFVRNAQKRRSGIGRRWLSEDGENEESLFSVLAARLARKQSRPEITEL